MALPSGSAPPSLPSTATILVVDDHDLVRLGLRTVAGHADLLETDESSGLGVNQCGLGMDANGNAMAVWNQADATDVYRFWSSLFH